MLELLYATGMRVAELVGLDVADVTFGNRTVKVTGKGDKQRVMPFGAPADKALRDWLEHGRPVLCGDMSDDAFFLGRRAADRSTYGAQGGARPGTGGRRA